MPRKPKVTIVGAGSLAKSLVPALHDAGYAISEIVSREVPASRRSARSLARQVGARASTAKTARLSAPLIWLCVPDREIYSTAAALAQGRIRGVRFAFHCSGALTSRELEPLRGVGAAVASVHPLMTFVAGAQPSLRQVPFALEGDAAAVGLARRIVARLGGESFVLPASRKAAYHAWATMTSPLLLSFLVTLEEAAVFAGLPRADGRRKSLPIIRQTLDNYARLGPQDSFSGPLIRGDVETVARHLAVMKGNPAVRDVYLTLARSAMRRLPTRKGKELLRLLEK